MDGGAEGVANGVSGPLPDSEAVVISRGEEEEIPSDECSASTGVEV